jgi:IS605 OrfB family transposase
MTAVQLREWRGVKPVAGPSGAAIMTRLRTTQAEDAVLDAVAGHLGRLRRADLAAASRPEPPDAGLDSPGRRQARQDKLNVRKQDLTALSSARWANAVIAANDAQYRRSRDAQDRHIAGLDAAITAIEKRLSAPTADTLTSQERAARRKNRLPKGYATQVERFQKQRRLQSLRAELRRAAADRDGGRVRVTEGGKRLAKTRHNLDAAGLTVAGWREAWEAARWRIEAIGTGTESFGNLTITVTPHGQVSIRLPRPLEHLANAPRGRYILSSTASFAYRGDEWLSRITGGRPVSYTITRKAGRAGVYLTAVWATAPETPSFGPKTPGSEVRATGPVVGVDLNDGHLAVRRLDEHGNPAGRPERIEFALVGSTARRDAQVRHAVTRIIRYTKRRDISAIAVEDLDFADARATGRETMGRGRRGKRFRKTVAGIPTAVVRRRLTAQARRHGIRLWAVNPAYTSDWGDQHWRKPYENVTRHEAAATVIGRRAQGHKARRREGVTRARPEDRAVRATNQAGASDSAVSTGSRHRPGTRGGESRAPGRARTRLPGRATVTPATTDAVKHASNGSIYYAAKVDTPTDAAGIMNWSRR